MIPFSSIWPHGCPIQLRNRVVIIDVTHTPVHQLCCDGRMGPAFSLCNYNTYLVRLTSPSVVRDVHGHALACARTPNQSRHPTCIWLRSPYIYIGSMTFVLNKGQS